MTEPVLVVRSHYRVCMDVCAPHDFTKEHQSTMHSNDLSREVSLKVHFSAYNSSMCTSFGRYLTS